MSRREREVLFFGVGIVTPEQGVSYEKRKSITSRPKINNLIEFAQRKRWLGTLSKGSTVTVTFALFPWETGPKSS
jgi:hypothetical protein